MWYPWIHHNVTKVKIYHFMLTNCILHFNWPPAATAFIMMVKHKTYVDKFKLPKILDYNIVSLRGVARSWEKPVELSLHNPATLVDLCAAVLDRQLMPPCMAWKTDRVLDWLENTVKLPQYKDCFTLNYVTGRHLINIGPNHLVRMNIHIWDHIVQIMTHIRLLYGVPRPKFARDLTKPCLYGTEYDWDTLYYRYIAWMSPGHEVARSVYWRRAKMMNSREEAACHWYSIKTSEDTEGKIVVARVRQVPKKVRYYMPRFREGHFVPTVKKVYYLDGDPFSY